MAVATLLNREQSKVGSWRIGLNLGVGHMLTLVIIGAIGLLLNLTIPLWFETSAEIFGGILLIVLGLWTLSYYFQSRTHSHKHIQDKVEHKHVHVHVHVFDTKHKHTHSKLLGALFALSGFRSLLLIMPVAFAASIYDGMINISLFGAGLVVSILVFGLVIAALQNFTKRTNSHKIVTCVTGGLSLVTGIFWIVVRI